MARNTTPDILFSDQAVVIVNKPAGLLSIPDRYKPDLPNLQRQLQQHFEHIWTVHRLDRDTSGVMIFARTEEAHRHLSMQFEHRKVRKIYLAFTDGHPPAASGEINTSLAHHPARNGKMVVDPRGKKALTYYHERERFKHATLLEVDIRTGRTHQIRVHLASIGAPLLVDPLYGKHEAFFLSEIKRQKYNLGKDQEERPLVKRLTLHAHKLQYQHPVSGETLTQEASLPKDLRALLRQLQKWDR